MRQLDSVSQAVMLVRSSLVSHGELIGTLNGCAFYTFNTGTVKTIIARPSGIRAEGVVPHDVHAGDGELIGTKAARAARKRSSRST